MLACAHDEDGKTVDYLLKHKANVSIADNKVSNISLKIIMHQSFYPFSS